MKTKTKKFMSALFEVLIALLSIFMATTLFASEEQNSSSSLADLRPAKISSQGQYFTKKQYQPAPLPQFESVKNKLPAPIFKENPLWVRMYWKSWELAFRNFHEPGAGSGYVSQFIDAAFNDNIFQWDTCFMTMFCNCAHPLVPGISSLDNFYCKQYEDGEISREINRTTGVCYSGWDNVQRKPLYSAWGWGTNEGNVPVVYRDRKAPDLPPHVTLDALNHPIFSWAELEHCKMTGDKERIALVYVPLIRYRQALNTYLRQGNGLYMTDWASMDNSQRNPHLYRGGCGIDISSEMVMFSRDLAFMADMLGKKNEAEQFRKEAEETAALINKLMWDPEKKFYFDLTLDGKRAPIKTIAGFWTLLAEIPSSEQAEHLVAQLKNPQTFAREHRVPTLAADESGYNPDGEYWRGSVWAPTETMVIRGLERYGQADLAREIAINHLTVMGKVFEKTGTVWENYAPDKIEPGQPAKSDFVGWSGLGPILYLLEYGIGLRPDALQNELQWNLRSTKPLGCERYRFNGHIIDLRATPERGKWLLHIVSDGEFLLKATVEGKSQTFNVKNGINDFEIVAN